MFGFPKDRDKLRDEMGLMKQAFQLTDLDVLYLVSQRNVTS